MHNQSILYTLKSKINSCRHANGYLHKCNLSVLSQTFPLKTYFRTKYNGNIVKDDFSIEKMLSRGNGRTRFQQTPI